MIRRSTILLTALLAFPANAADLTAPLFPAPFTVERQISERNPSGGVEHQTDPFTEFYGESYLVAVRPGEDRTIIDFGRREIIEVQISKGTYWVLSFSRMRELRERIGRADGSLTREARKPQTGASTAARIRIESIDDGARVPLASGVPAKHLRASAEGSAQIVDVWLDGSLRLTKPAQDALRSFEDEALGELTVTERPSLSMLMSALRASGDGALPVKTSRLLTDRDGRATGFTVEDTALKAAPIPAFPKKLLVLPESLKRVSSPLEIMAAFEEDEAALRSRGK